MVMLKLIVFVSFFHYFDVEFWVTILLFLFQIRWYFNVQKIPSKIFIFRTLSHTTLVANPISVNCIFKHQSIAKHLMWKKPSLDIVHSSWAFPSRTRCTWKVFNPQNVSIKLSEFPKIPHTIYIIETSPYIGPNR